MSADRSRPLGPQLVESAIVVDVAAGGDGVVVKGMTCPVVVVVAAAGEVVVDTVPLWNSHDASTLSRARAMRQEARPRWTEVTRVTRDREGPSARGTAPAAVLTQPVSPPPAVDFRAVRLRDKYRVRTRVRLLSQAFARNRQPECACAGADVVLCPQLGRLGCPAARSPLRKREVDCTA